MPFWVECIDFGIGIFGFFITILTLRTTCSVKKHIIRNAELDSFRQNLPNILGKINGYINSINEDKIYASDNNRSFKPELSQFLTDVESQFTFLSQKSSKPIHTLQKMLNNPDISHNDWECIAKQLIILKNMIQKEDLYHG